MGRILGALTKYVGDFLACGSPDNYAKRFGVTYDDPSSITRLFNVPMAYFLGPPEFEGDSGSGVARVKFAKWAGCVEAVPVSRIQV